MYPFSATFAGTRGSFEVQFNSIQLNFVCKLWFIFLGSSLRPSVGQKSHGQTTKSGWKPVKNNQWLSDRVREAKGPDNSKFLRLREDDDTEMCLKMCFLLLFSREDISWPTQEAGQVAGGGAPWYWQLSSRKKNSREIGKHVNVRGHFASRGAADTSDEHLNCACLVSPQA